MEGHQRVDVHLTVIIHDILGSLELRESCFMNFAVVCYPPLDGRPCFYERCVGFRSVLLPFQMGYSLSSVPLAYVCSL